MNLSNELLLLSLTDFYKESNNMSRFIKIIDGTSNISLRLIDWYITNYCKNNNEFFYCYERNFGRDYCRATLWLEG